MAKAPKLVGFRTPQRAHAHVLKHVLGVDTTEKTSVGDPERWADLIGEPPLIAEPRRRRQEAEALLERVPGCKAGRAQTWRACHSCQDVRAIRVVDQEMSSLMQAYVACAQSALDAAFENPDRHGPRVVAFRAPGGHTKIEATDPRHLRLSALVGSDPSRALLLTCYRTPGRSFRSHWLELARLRAAHRRAGTLVPIT